MKDTQGLTMKMAELLHEWYLEACKELNPKSFNPKAQKPFSQLSKEQRYIDVYIARKVIRSLRIEVKSDSLQRDVSGNSRKIVSWREKPKKEIN